MAVLQTILNFFVPVEAEEPEIIIPAPPTVYEVHTLTAKHLKEVLRLNLRCFRKGENYTKYTFSYLLEIPNGLSYRAVAENGEMVGFLFVSTMIRESDISRRSALRPNIASAVWRKCFWKKPKPHCEKKRFLRLFWKFASIILRRKCSIAPAVTRSRREFPNITTTAKTVS